MQCPGKRLYIVFSSKLCAGVPLSPQETWNSKLFHFGSSDFFILKTLVSSVYLSYCCIFSISWLIQAQHWWRVFTPHLWNTTRMTWASSSPALQEFAMLKWVELLGNNILCHPWNFPLKTTPTFSYLGSLHGRNTRHSLRWRWHTSPSHLFTNQCSKACNK